MEIYIKSFLEGAKKAKGVTIIIDVFRAGNTIISCLTNGADYVKPVGTLQDAYQLKEKQPGDFLAGERKSYPPEGFDFGNSPSEASMINFSGKGVILTTSSGTQGIVNAVGSEEIIIGTFANLTKVTEYLHRKNPSTITLVPMGFESREKADEDECYAQFLKEKLEGKNPDFALVKEKILTSKGAQRLINIGKEDDLSSCLIYDSSTIIPRLDKSSGRLVKAEEAEKNP
jgi:2-phosphosulfolactate phosphatase